MKRRWLAVALIAGAIGVRGAAAQDVPEESGEPADPNAMKAPARALITGADRPDVPAQPPDRFAPMAFENHTSIHALDWLEAALPLELGEKVEAVLNLQPAYDAWVVPAGPVVAATADNVAAFAARVNARWVWTGWVERPNWQLHLVVTLWKVDGGVATQAGQGDVTGAFVDVHKLLGAAVTAAARAGGFAVDDAAAATLAAPVTRDLYSLTLVGRGLGHERGLGGKVDLRAAEHDLTRAVFIEPTMSMGNRLVGQFWLDHPSAKDAQDPHGAQKAAERAAGKFAYAVDLQPGYLPALRASAAAARQAGKHEVARDLYDRLVRMRPWDLDARVYLGEALWQTGDGSGALIELNRVIAHAPDDLRARRLIALVHAERGDLDQLAAALEEIARRAPDDLDVRLDLGATYGALGRWDDARAAYLVVATAKPDDPNVLKLVGDVERHRGDAAAAASWYGRMEKAAPDDPRPPFLIGQAWLEAGDLARAHKALIRTQTFKDEIGYAYTALGAVQFRAGLYDESLWYLRRAAKARPHSAAARVALARILLTKKQGAEALTQVAAARSLGGDGPELDYLAAIAEAQTGDLDAAKASVRAAAGAGMDEARRASVAIDRGDVPDVEGAPAADIPFGDVGAYQASIDHFLAAEAAMAQVRKQLDDQVLAALARLGEGPGKDLSKAARQRPWSRSCPVAGVAAPFVAARQLEIALYRKGLVLDEAYRRVATLDELGETAGLTPDYRRKVADVKVAWKRALVGVREVKNELTIGLGRELTARRCKEALLVAAAAHPELYGRPEDSARAPAVPVSAPPPPPSQIAIYVDNRECTEALGVWIDGAQVGTAPPGKRAAFEVPAGRRTLCLLQRGDAQCGDRGTVRTAYLYDGWSTMVHCRGGTGQAPEALPGPSAEMEQGVEVDAGVDDE